VGWVFDSEDFNSEEEAEYHFKVEEVESLYSTNDS